MKAKKVALAYSGGLDTSIIIPYLKETYGCEVVAIAVDVGQQEETAGLADKAYRTGACDFYLIEAKEEFAREYLFPVLKAGAIYEREAVDRAQAGGDRSGYRLRCGGPWLHRQRKRSSSIRAGLSGAGAGAEDHRAVARVVDHFARRGDRFCGGARYFGSGDEEGSVLARSQPVAPLPRRRPAGGSGVRAGGLDVQVD